MTEARWLYGRDREKDRLGRFLDELVAGAAHTVVVGGEAGIGKSRLLAEAARDAHRRGIVIHQHVAQLRDRVRDGEARGFRSSAPELFVLDDVEVAPEDVLQALLEVRPGGSPPVGLLLARGAKAQQGARRPMADELCGGGSALALGSLRDEEVHQLVSELIEVPPLPGLWDVVQCASGNPRLVVDLVEGLLEEGRIDNGDLVPVTPGRLPARVRGAIDRYIRCLHPDSLNLLQVGTVLGRTFQLWETATMLGTTTSALLPILDQTLSMGILAFTDEGLSFQHPVVLRAVYESIPEQVRAELHREARQVTRGVRAGSSGPGSLAVLGRQEVVHRSKRVGAANGIGPVGAVRTLLKAGFLESAVLLARTTLDRAAPGRESAELRCLLIDILVMSGRPTEAVAEADRVLAETDLPGVTLDAAAASRMFGLFLKDDPQAREQASQALGYVARPADSGQVMAAATALSTLEWHAGQIGEALRWGRVAVDEAGGAVASAGCTYARLALAWKLSALGEIDEAESLLAGVRGQSDRDYLAVFEPAVDLVHAVSLLRGGRSEPARQVAETALEAASTAGFLALVPVASALLCLIGLRTGDGRLADEHLRRCRDAARQATPFFTVHLDWLDLLVRAERDGLRQAAQHLGAVGTESLALRQLLVEEPVAAALLVRMAGAGEDPALAETVLACVESLAADNPGVTSIALSAAHARGLHGWDMAELARAAAGYGDPWARTCARDDLARLLAEPPPPQDRRDEPVQLTVRDHVGRMTVVEVPTRAAAAPDAEGWDGLSETERAIAALVADGLTNRQVAERVFLSPHTVNYYLRRIFGKLGIRSRVELARYRHG